MKTRMAWTSPSIKSSNCPGTRALLLKRWLNRWDEIYFANLPATSRLRRLTMVLGCLLSALPVYGLVVHRDTEVLVASSQIIATGIVSNIQFLKDSLPARITKVTLQNAKILKGGHAEPPQLTVFTFDPGRLETPRFHLGEEVLVFCSNNANGQCFITDYQEKYSVEHGFLKRGRDERPQAIGPFMYELKAIIGEQSHLSKIDADSRYHSIRTDVDENALDRALRRFQLFKELYPSDGRIKPLGNLLLQAYRCQSLGHPRSSTECTAPLDEQN